MKSLKEEMKFARRQGYKVTTDRHNHITDIVKGQRHVWSIMLHDRDLLMGWQTADLIDGYYCNHKKYKSLMNALNRPLTNNIK